MKVYCDDCKYLKEVKVGYVVKEPKCFYIIGYKDTPYKLKPIYAEPEENNKDNKCPYFKPKLFKRRKYRK